MDEIKARFKISGPDLDRDEIIVGRQGLRVGRGADNNLVLNHRELSRQHMRFIWREDDKYLVEDLNSSNGVWFNEARIPPRVPQGLTEGDVIRCGPYLFTFVDLVYPEVNAIRPVEARAEALPSVKAGAKATVNTFSNQSTWLQYLPAIYADDEFLGRYLLIFESIMNPIVWRIDNFDLYLSPDNAPAEWLQWMASWFDMLILPELPLENQREIMRQIGWLFMRRGTPSGLQRLLELYFGVQPEIVENQACHFMVRLPLSQTQTQLTADVANRLILSQKPAFASYTLEIT